MSKRSAHPALVTSEIFIAVQGMHSDRADDSITRRRSYLLAGLIRCAGCGRKMDTHWINNRAGYRCRHGHRSSRSNLTGQPGHLYLREDELLERLHRQLEWPDQATEGLAGYLRGSGVTITCDHQTLSLSEGQQKLAK